MALEIDEGNLKKGLLGLVIALVEIIQELLEREAIKRIENGSLEGREIENLGEALLDLKSALETIKTDNEIEDTVDSIIYGLDEIVHEAVEKFMNPLEWVKEESNERKRRGKIPLLNPGQRH
ncbi:gas vesicle protein GvpK [Methanosarcina sp. Mfa9]|uniref:gas vesicle protein GvpK n=1 Tax=Methanosarcina sp. Mfa9 TaxID=3439063 RepID=UPI003F8248B6